MSGADVHDAVGPDLPALSKEDRQWAEAIVDAIESLPTLTEDELEERAKRKNPSAARWADEPGAFGYEEWSHRLPRLGLPGFGETRKDPPCGTNLPHVCEDCGERHDVGRTCAQNRCPRCAPAWVVDRAPGHVAKVNEAAKMKSAASDGGTAVYKHHGVLQPPRDILIDSDDPLDTFFRTAVRNFMQAIDMDGHAYYHPWSGDNDEGEDDRGKWKQRLFSGRDWEGDVLEELKPFPHVHLVGACPWFPGQDVVKYVNEKTGWVIRRFTERNGSPVSLGNMKAIARATTYTMSHLGIEQRESGNYAMMRTYGSAIHNTDGRDEPEAEEAVRDVARETLDLPASDLECQNKLPEEEVDSETEPEPPDAEDGDDTDADAEDDGPEMATCRGNLALVSEHAEQIEDPDWQQTALHAEEAVALLERWREVGGWQGWVEQEAGAPEDVDGPPPD